MAVEKITETFKCGLTESEFNDLSRLAALRDRSLSEYVRVHLIRPHLYGNVRRGEIETEAGNSIPAPL